MEMFVGDGSIGFVSSPVPGFSAPYNFSFPGKDCPPEGLPLEVLDGSGQLESVGYSVLPTYYMSSELSYQFGDKVMTAIS